MGLKSSKNSMLLRHGTKKSNVLGIMQTGFRIAPPEAYRSGNLLGDGIYFADRFGKAAEYSDISNWGYNYKQKEKYAYIFLCEVMLGNCKFARSHSDVNK